MGGGGAGGPFHDRSPDQLARQVRKAEDETAIKKFESELSEILSEQLAEANSRDVELVADRLSVIKEELAERLEKTIDTLYGGSVAKHTYVDGLSDVDSLIVINDTALENSSPAEVLNSVSENLRSVLNDVSDVSTGSMAVTVTYSDGMQIQLLPALKTSAGVKVPSARHDGWSSISPDKFTDALSKTNQACGMKLIPTIKLAKSVIGNLPEAQRLSGYHIESLAIEAFKNHSGSLKLSEMLPKFFNRAKDLVATPIRDSTGQSVHVDEYLGSANSESRAAMGHVLARIEKRMRNASANMSKDQWEALLGSK